MTKKPSDADYTSYAAKTGPTSYQSAADFDKNPFQTAEWERGNASRCLESGNASRCDESINP